MYNPCDQNLKLWLKKKKKRHERNEKASHILEKICYVILTKTCIQNTIKKTTTIIWRYTTQIMSKIFKQFTKDLRMSSMKWKLKYKEITTKHPLERLRLNRLELPRWRNLAGMWTGTTTWETVWQVCGLFCFVF